ncbi:MAG: signal peptidase II [Candidatus Binatia bacterium]
MNIPTSATVVARSSLVSEVLRPTSASALTALAGGIVILDRLTKYLVMSSMSPGDSVAVVPGFFSLTYVTNRGGAFGMFADLGETWRLGFFVVVALVAVGLMGWMFLRTPPGEVLHRAGLAAVMGGALGNLYDRLAWGKVVDFFDVFVGSWHWPAFNVADSFITIGVAALLISSFRAGSPNEIVDGTSK